MTADRPASAARSRPQRPAARRRGGRVMPHRSWGQRLMIGVSVALTLVCLLAASGLTYTITKVDQINLIDLGQDPDDTVAKAAPGEAQNFLLVGVDRSTGLDPNDPILAGREGEQNSDTIMVIRVDPPRKSVSILSLPRDLWVPIGGPTGPESKINSALAAGGAITLVKTVADSLKIPVHHYLEIDLRGFKNLIGVIGGVNMEFRYSARDVHSHLDETGAGCITLDPDQALAFARSRQMEINKDGYWQADGGNDLARAKRQQELIRGAVRKAISMGARNPATLNAMIDEALKNTRWSGGVTLGDMVDMASEFRDLDPAAIDTYEPSVTEEMIGSAAALRLNERQSQPIFEIFRGHNPFEDVRPFVRVEVRSSTGEKDKASFVGLELAANKFTVTATKDDFNYRGMPTRILFADEASKMSAVILARYLDLDVPILQGPVWTNDAQVALVVGTDWAGVRKDPRPLSDFAAHLPPTDAGGATSTTLAGAPSTTSSVPFAVTTSSVAGEIPEAPQGC